MIYGECFRRGYYGFEGGWKWKGLVLERNNWFNKVIRNDVCDCIGVWSYCFWIV